MSACIPGEDITSLKNFCNFNVIALLNFSYRMVTAIFVYHVCTR
ncbi:hypothetical protein SAMN04488688_10338 [Paenibacillus sp. cl141a]|nr:hypothetical protein SAMN04488688_10338 [Paenibacillus sp. cl141a]